MMAIKKAAQEEENKKKKEKEEQQAKKKAEKDAWWAGVMEAAKKRWEKDQPKIVGKTYPRHPQVKVYRGTSWQSSIEELKISRKFTKGIWGQKALQKMMMILMMLMMMRFLINVVRQ
eukprot:9337120-Karenia_brevis.AAC.1